MIIYIAKGYWNLNYTFMMVNVAHHSEHLHEVTLATEAFSFLFLYDTSLGLLLPFYLLSQLEAIIPYQNNSYYFLIMTIKVLWYKVMCKESAECENYSCLPTTLSESSQRQGDLHRKGRKGGGSTCSYFLLLLPLFPVAAGAKQKWESERVRVATQ